MVFGMVDHWYPEIRNNSLLDYDIQLQAILLNDFLYFSAYCYRIRP